MNPRVFLSLADVWLTGAGEGEWRSATSRSYYAAFHVARNALASWGFRVPRADSAHAYLWLRLANSAHPGVSQAGDDLHDLRRERNRADYDLGIPFLQAQARSDVVQARSIIAALDALAGDAAARALVIDAIRVYERDVLKTVTWRPPTP